MKRLFTAFYLSLLMAGLAFAQTTITIDGDMSDWDDSMQMDIAPNQLETLLDSVDLNWDGTMDTVVNAALDVENFYMTHDDNYLYVRIDINEDGTFTDLQSMVAGGYQAALEIFLDTDCSDTTGLTWGWWKTSGDYWINLSVPYGWPDFQLKQKYGIMKFVGATGTDSQWEEVMGDSCLVAVNVDDNKMEVAIPRAAIGETAGEFESTGILLLGEDPTAGWTADIVPNMLGDLPRTVYRYGKKMIHIDGDMSDWTGYTQFDIAPNMTEGLNDSVDADWDGTMDGVINPALDIKDIYVTHDDIYLYVRVDINENGTFTDLDGLVDAEGYKAPIQLYFDVDMDSSTGLTWGYWLNGGDYYVNITDPDGNPGLEVTQQYGILKFTGQNGNDESFEEVMGDSCIVSINADDNIIEVAIPRAAIGETNLDSDTTGILVFAEDPTTDWVNDVAPNDDGGFRNVYLYGHQVQDSAFTSIDEKLEVKANSFSLLQNYPNPFNPSTTIKYTLKKAQDVNIAVYNVLGQRISTLVNAKQAQGLHQVVWNGKDNFGRSVASGVYFYRIKTQNGSMTKKMVLAR
jgi:hypothetical protein